jgi:hypothetical protein
MTRKLRKGRPLPIKGKALGETLSIALLMALGIAAKTSFCQRLHSACRIRPGRREGAQDEPLQGNARRRAQALAQ